ncbi:MAG TPA: hypothetical protein VE011_12795 [Candidatus Dormibacteraeota bacterium]|nr:hypothetical protein [Candidatus Dormibacteraeota bacterium]
MAHLGPLARPRRAGGVVLATLLAMFLAAAPPAARTALAASPLRVQADTIYRLDPAAGRVHVEIDFKVTDLKPDSAQFVYFYRDLSFAIQPEASSVKASGFATSVSTTQHQYFVEADVHLRSNLYYRQSASFAVRYDLLGGAPRSASPIRVGKAFATFGVWSWGDVGRSTVTVRTPAGYVSTVDGDPMQTTTDLGVQTLTATPMDPTTFFAIVSSEDSAAYGSTRISLTGGVEIVIKAWPEDKVWDKTVGDTLRKAMPELETLIGLPWPVAHDLDVRERYTPALEGYAGFYVTDAQRIDVTEDLDPVVIVHEASHAWFNDSLFTERWLYEGLAEEYAWRVQTDVGGDAGLAPARPDPTDPGHVVLVGWTFPQVIRDQTTDDRERYGYGAAFYVVDQMVKAAGADQMRLAFAAAKAHRTAYVGAGAPETSSAINDWRHLLDLIEPIDKPDSAAVETALRDFAISPTDATALDTRTPARVKYRALLAAGAGWLPPWYVRKLMDTWTFVGASKAMDAATTVLALRDQVESAAAALGLEPDVSLRKAYEGATDGFKGATDIANAELAALAAIADAKAGIEQAPDFVTQLGLGDTNPKASYAAARTAFQAGQLDQAVRDASAASAVLAAAPAIGQQRLLVIGVGVGGGLLLVLLVVVLLRRRRRAAVLAPASAAATLADPSEASTPPSTTTPDDAGGPAP